MVTNNEVSAEEEDRLKAAGYHPGQEEWDKWGIARYVNWPRTKCSILGVDVNGEPLKGNYQTYLKHEKEKERNIKQITLIDDPSSLKTAQKKELVALCCQGKLPQRLVKADSKFIVSEEHPCSILFDINYAEEWLDELDG
jgi:adenine-specific DNA-methyltransferase